MRISQKRAVILACLSSLLHARIFISQPHNKYIHVCNAYFFNEITLYEKVLSSKRIRHWIFFFYQILAWLPFFSPLYIFIYFFLFIIIVYTYIYFFSQASRVISVGLTWSTKRQIFQYTVIAFLHYIHTNLAAVASDFSKEKSCEDRE